jgi:hypothetical protein
LIQKVITASITVISDPDVSLASTPFLNIPYQSGGDVLPIDRVSIPLLALSSRLTSMMPDFYVDEYY